MGASEMTIDYPSTTSSTSSSSVTYLPNSRRRRIFLTEPSIVWFESIKRRLEYLVQLQFGWDGYNGLPVNFDNAYFALKMLENICDVDTPAPQIVPGTNGDLQIEWHTLNGDIELHVIAPNNVLAWIAEEGVAEVGIELPLTNDFTSVAAWVNQITEPQIATEAAAA